MKLFLYVIKEYFKYVIGTSSVTVFLFVLFDFMHKTTKYFSVYNPSTKDMILLYLYQIPFQVIQTLPISALISSVVTMVLLSRTNEITVMRAAGLGPKYIVSPLAIGGLFLSLMSLLINEFVVPEASSRMRYIQKVNIEGESQQEFSNGPGWARKDGLLINFKEYDPLNHKILDVNLIELGKDFSIKNYIFGEFAKYSEVDKEWVIPNAIFRRFDSRGNLINFSNKKDFQISLPIEPNKLKVERRIPDEMSVVELREIIFKGEASGKDVLAQKISFHVKWAYPFASFFVSLLGIRFAFASERKTESVKGVLIAFLVGISYWFIFSAARAFGSRGDISPFFAAWTANAVMLLISVYQFWKVRRA